MGMLLKYVLPCFNIKHERSNVQFIGKDFYPQIRIDCSADTQ